jgi:manganese/zinc/iron transport system substrate-binding protein
MTRSLLPVTLLGLLLIAACGGGGGDVTERLDADDDAVDRAEDKADRPPLQVVATTTIVGDLVRAVGGDRVEVTVLMGPGIDPHGYKASAGDVERIRQADIVFTNGLHLEAKMGEVLAGSPRPTVPVAEAVPTNRRLQPAEYAGAHDPHVWFDLELWQLAAGAVEEALAERDHPDFAGDYNQRAAAYANQLAELHDYAASTLGTIPDAQQVLITAHDAFGYLGRAYGLEVRGLQGISTASEAGTADVQDLATFIAENRIPAIFVEHSVSRRAIEAVREAVRARNFDVELGGVLYSDSLGDPFGPAGDFLGMVRHNVDTITTALGGQVPGPREADAGSVPEGLPE